jgi:hypothetical protein
MDQEQLIFGQAIFLRKVHHGIRQLGPHWQFHGKNIRQQVSDTDELAKSIEHKGLLQPILVRTMDVYFEVVAGNRRRL